MRRLATFLLSLPALAQGPFVVDINNGPGTAFTEIQAAVSAVPSGSTLLVRPGAYQPVMIDNKGLVVLCDAGVTAGAWPGFGFLRIQNTQPQHLVCVVGLQQAIQFGVTITGCQGPVVIDGLGATYVGSPFTGENLVQGSPQVALRNLNLSGRPGIRIDASSVVCDRCVILGLNAYFTSKATGDNGAPAVDASNSLVQLVQSPATGGNGAIGIGPWFVVRPGASAVRLTAASLRAMGSSSHAITGGSTPGIGQLPAISGSGIARIEPNIPLTGTPVAPGVTLTRPPMPGLVSDSTAPGGVLQVQRTGAAGVLAAVAISLPGSAFQVPGLDPIWLDASSLVVEGIAITTAAPLTVQKVVPAVAALRGFQIVWQAADLAPLGLVEVSNPSPCFVR